MSQVKTIKLALIAGEKSGDQLGGDLIAAFRERFEGSVELVGVGGEAMAAQGLRPLFDYRELSIIGFSAVIARLPQLLWRIHTTARNIATARPDVLVIIDSPDFTHRVARRVRRLLPDMPIINYVCPTVWAWKPERAPRMRAYVDHVLSVFPFEAEIVTKLEGPRVTYVGHRLMFDPDLAAAIDAQGVKRRQLEDLTEDAPLSGGCCLLLPGSRKGEITRLLPAFGQTAMILSQRRPDIRFVLPTLAGLEQAVRAETASWPVSVEVVVGDARKWQAFQEADAALAASGTVLLELALAGIPCISTYKLDPIAKLLVNKVTAWTAALPNYIADYPIISEYIDKTVRPGLLARRLERLISNSSERRTMMQSFDLVRERMRTQVPAGQLAADTILHYLRD